MIIYNLNKKEKLYSLNELTDQNELYFVIATPEDKCELQNVFHFGDEQPLKETTDQIIHFQIYETFDFVRLLYMDLEGEEFIHHKLHLYLGKQALVVTTDDPDFVDGMLTKEIEECQDNIFIGREKINHLYYHIFHYVLHDMFLKLEIFEAILLTKEDNLMEKTEKSDFSSLISLKRTANEIKRNMRLLSYVSDEILANDGGFLLESDLNLFRSINIRTKKIYDFSVSIQEASLHLLTVYDSKISEQTNSFMNTFTVITLFITPLTFISSLYAMNFIGTPILSFKYGVWIFVFLCLSFILSTTCILKKNKWI